MPTAILAVCGSLQRASSNMALLRAAGMTGGVRAQVQLVQVLSAMDVPVIETFTVPMVKAKLGPDGAVADPAALRRLAAALEALAAC